MPSHEWYAARAREKLHAHQMALPPEKRLINRTDWDDEISHRIAVTTSRTREDIKRKFIELVVHPHLNICKTRDQARAYFSRGGPPLTGPILRKFTEAYAISARPILIKNMLSARSCADTLIHLWSAAKAAGNPVPFDVKQELMVYVFGPLVERGLLHTMSRKKFLAVGNDLSTFLKVLFTPRFATMLTSTRELLLLALFICLQVDCSSRVSELVMTNMNLEDREAFAEKHPKKMFRWRSVEIFAFPNQGPGGRVTLRARLTFSDLKDSTMLKMKLKEKSIPLRLLPPSFAAEDSLFLLVTLGLIDGVFANVFRATNFHAKVGDELVSKKQMTSQQIVLRLHRLSQFCGLSHAMLPHVLRRSSSYLLALTVTPEEGTARMGHSHKSKAKAVHYRSSTSTVDFQALRHKLDQEDVARLSSVFLNTSAANPPPKTISDAGLLEIQKDPELIAISTQLSKLHINILLRYDSLDVAKTEDPARYSQYDNLRKKHTAKIQYLKTKKFSAEYTAWCAARDEGPLEQTVAQVSTNDSSDEIKQLLDQSECLDDHTSSDTVPTDPSVLEEEATEAAAAAKSIATALSAVKDDGNDESAVVIDDDELNPMGVVQEARNSEDTMSRSSRKRRVFIKTDEDVPLHTLVDHLPKYLYSQPDQNMTWAEISAVCTITFNHLHSPGRFYPNQEPQPGTWECRFCGVTFLGDEIPQKTLPESHSCSCEAERLAKHALEALPNNALVDGQKCPLGGCSSEKWNTSVQFTAHARTSKKHVLIGQDDQYLCKNHESPVTFSSLDDLRIHVIRSHAAPKEILPKNISQVLAYFCVFCQVLISRLDEYEEVHIKSHVRSGEASAIIAQHGLAGSERQGVWAHPCFCIFCLYDTRLSILKRFASFQGMQGLSYHVSNHVMRMADAMPCPAAGEATPEMLPQCAQTTHLDAAGLKKHLEEIHGYRNLETAKAKKPNKISKRSQEHVEGVQSDENNDTAKKRKTGGGEQPLGELDTTKQPGEPQGRLG